jgi:hypothetical protein
VCVCVCRLVADSLRHWRQLSAESREKERERAKTAGIIDPSRDGKEALYTHNHRNQYKNKSCCFHKSKHLVKIIQEKWQYIALCRPVKCLKVLSSGASAIPDENSLKHMGRPSDGRAQNRRRRKHTHTHRHTNTRKILDTHTQGGV